MLDWGRGLEWDRFCALAVNEHTGIVGRVYDLYFRESVKVFTLENIWELYEWLERPLQLENLNANGVSVVTQMTWEQVKAIERAEVSIMERFYKE